MLDRQLCWVDHTPYMLQQCTGLLLWLVRSGRQNWKFLERYTAEPSKRHLAVTESRNPSVNLWYNNGTAYSSISRVRSESLCRVWWQTEVKVYYKRWNSDILSGENQHMGRTTGAARTSRMHTSMEANKARGRQLGWEEDKQQCGQRTNLREMGTISGNEYGTQLRLAKGYWGYATYIKENPEQKQVPYLLFKNQKRNGRRRKWNWEWKRGRRSKVTCGVKWRIWWVGQVCINVTCV